MAAGVHPHARLEGERRYFSEYEQGAGHRSRAPRTTWSWHGVQFGQRPSSDAAATRSWRREVRGVVPALSERSHGAVGLGSAAERCGRVHRTIHPPRTRSPTTEHSQCNPESDLRRSGPVTGPGSSSCVLASRNGNFDAHKIPADPSVRSCRIADVGLFHSVWPYTHQAPMWRWTDWSGMTPRKNFIGLVNSSGSSATTSLERPQDKHSSRSCRPLTIIRSPCCSPR